MTKSMGKNHPQVPTGGELGWTISTRVPAETYSLLQKEAKDNFQNLAELLRQLLEKGMANRVALQRQQAEMRLFPGNPLFGHAEAISWVIRTAQEADRAIEAYEQEVKRYIALSEGGALNEDDMLEVIEIVRRWDGADAVDKWKEMQDVAGMRDDLRESKEMILDLEERMEGVV